MDVVVTGGGGALGREVVRRLARTPGLTIHVPDRAAQVPAELAGLGPAVRWMGGVDMTDEERTVAFYEAIPALWASVHLAGGFATAPLVDTSLATFRGLLELNATTCFLACREAVRAMRRRGHGGPAGGRIVNVAARPVLVPAPRLAAYAASKAAVAALTTTLATELAPEQILVNAVVPSIIDTPANRASMPAADPAPWPRPAEIAETIGWLISPENTLTWGALVPVYGRA